MTSIGIHEPWETKTREVAPVLHYKDKVKIIP